MAPFESCRSTDMNLLLASVTKWEVMGCIPGTPPEYSLLLQMHKMQKLSISQRLYPILLLALLAATTSAHTSLGVSQDLNSQPQLLKASVYHSATSAVVVGDGQMLLRALLLLGATIGWSASASQGQDGLVHYGNQFAHDVGAAYVRVVRRSWFATRCTGVIVVNFTTVGVTAVPILPTFIGSGKTNYLLLTTSRTTLSRK
jgi:hypothetical protein